MRTSQIRCAYLLTAPMIRQSDNPPDTPLFCVFISDSFTFALPKLWLFAYSLWISTARCSILAASYLSATARRSLKRASAACASHLCTGRRFRDARPIALRTGAGCAAHFAQWRTDKTCRDARDGRRSPLATRGSAECRSRRSGIWRRCAWSATITKDWVCWCTIISAVTIPACVDIWPGRDEFMARKAPMRSRKSPRLRT